MRKKLLNFVFIFLIILMCTTVAFASHIPTDITPSLNGNGSGKIEKMVTDVIGALMWIGYAIAVGMVVFIGIKYVIASADEKASLKGTLIKVFIGSLIIVLSIEITNFVLKIASY